MAASIDRGPQTPEHVTNGRFTEISTRIGLKEQFLAEGNFEEAAKIRIIVYFQGGGQAVAEEIGFVQEMYKRGWFRNGVVDAVIGGSGGSLVAAFGVTGDENGVSIFKRNCDKGFACLKNAVPTGRPVDFKGFEETLEEITPDVEALSQVRSQVLITTTTFNRTTQKRQAVDVRGMGQHELKQLLRASCLIPGVGNQQHVTIDGIQYNDGDLGGIPHEIIDSLNPTDVIIVGSGPFMPTQRTRRIGEAMGKLSHVVRDPAVRLALSSPMLGIRSVEEMLRRHWFEDPDAPVNYVHIGPEWGVLSMFENRWELLKERIETSRRSAARLFEGETSLLSEPLSA